MDRLPLPPRTNQPTVLRGGYHMVKVGREGGGGIFELFEHSTYFRWEIFNFYGKLWMILTP